MEDITDKQNFLREEIMDKGYNPQAFQEFMMQQSSTGDIDLDNWTMQDLRDVVEKFKQISVPQENAENVEENVIESSEEPQQVNNYEENNNNIVETNVTNEQNEQVNNINEGEQQQIQTENVVQVKEEENVVSSTNSNSTIIGASPYDNFEETITCKKLEPNQFSEIYNLYFTITEPEHKKNGLFSSGYFQYTITNKKDNSTIVRKLKDFDWLKSRLLDLYPGIFIPPIGPSHINLKDDSPKKIAYLSKFINALSQNRLVRATEFYKAFFSLSQEEFEQKKKELDKLPKPKSLAQFDNMEGVIHLQITKDLDNEALHLQKAINKKLDGFKYLDMAFDSLLSTMEEMNKKMKDLSKCFEDLKKLFEENNDSVMENYFEKFTNIMDDWATGYKNQRTFFKNELKYYFKYMQKEYKELLPLFTTFKSSRDAYESSFKKVKKLTVPNPKEEKSLQHLKRYYSYHLNSFLNESAALVSRHQERISNQLILLDENRSTYMQDYDHFIKLVHCNI